MKLIRFGDDRCQPFGIFWLNPPTFDTHDRYCARGGSTGELAARGVASAGA